MPRKRRVPKAHRGLRWDDVSINQKLDFWCVWAPPTNDFDRSRSSWQTWEEYLNHWAAVRDEALPEWRAKREEMIAGSRAEVARRKNQLEEVPPERDRIHWEGLVASAERNLAEREAEMGMPFAEEVYQAVLAGEEPEDAAWSRQRRRDRARAGQAWDDGTGDEEDEAADAWESTT